MVSNFPKSTRLFAIGQNSVQVKMIRTFSYFFDIVGDVRKYPVNFCGIRACESVAR